MFMFEVIASNELNYEI